MFYQLQSTHANLIVYIFFEILIRPSLNLFDFLLGTIEISSNDNSPRWHDVGISFPLAATVARVGGTGG